MREASAAHPHAAGRTGPALHLALTLFLAVFAAIAYGHVYALPFVNDDYVFVDKVRRTGFLALWLPHDLPFAWYRPWSREFHYWWMDRAFASSEPAAHLVSLGLWLVVLNLYAALAATLCGVRAAIVSTAALAALSLWAMPVSWVAGAQDLWMLTAGLAALRFLALGRTLPACLALLVALASKETAVLLVPIAAVVLWMRGVAPREWPRRLALPSLVALAWILLHPLTRARLAGAEAATDVITRPPLGATLAQTLLAPLDLDVAPRPDAGWISVLLVGGVTALVLAALVATQARGAATAPGRRILAGAAAWTLIGWLPLAMPGIGWHAYYGILGTMGLWIGLGAWLATRRAAAIAVVAALALLRQAAASSPSWDWGTEWYQRRASSFLGGIRAQLRTLHPRLPSHARLYFARIPNDIGMLAGDGPALRVWYGDSTLVAHYYSAYRTRRAGETPGPDYFFRFDTTRGLVPVLEGREPSPDLELEPDWTRDHEVLAALLLNAGDLERSLAEYRKLAAAHPDDAPYALYCGALLEALGRKAEAVPYFDRAGRTFGGRDAARATATRLLGDLRAPPP